MCTILQIDSNVSVFKRYIDILDCADINCTQCRFAIANVCAVRVVAVFVIVGIASFSIVCVCVRHIPNCLIIYRISMKRIITSCAKWTYRHIQPHLHETFIQMIYLMGFFCFSICFTSSLRPPSRLSFFRSHPVKHFRIRSIKFFAGVLILVTFSFYWIRWGIDFL